jgi:hypothetical protein
VSVLTGHPEARDPVLHTRASQSRSPPSKPATSHTPHLDAPSNTSTHATVTRASQKHKPPGINLAIQFHIFPKVDQKNRSYCTPLSTFMLQCMYATDVLQCDSSMHTVPFFITV